MEIFIARGEKRKGPYSEDAVRQFLTDGQLDGNELAWHEGLDGWVNVKEAMDSATPSIAQDSNKLDRSKIFISYRREDSEANTGRIHDRLTQKFPPETIFQGR